MNRTRADAWLARQIIRIASVMVPLRQREEWTSEWRSELWHLCHVTQESSCTLNCDALGFSIGSFQDALWLRCEHVRMSRSPSLAPGSAGRLLAVLSGWAVAGLLLCLMLPGARRALMPLSCRGAADLVVISTGGFAGTQKATIPVTKYREWRRDAAQLFSGMAFYRPVTRRVRLEGHPAAHLFVALASDNLLTLLNISDAVQAHDRNHVSAGARLILSRSAWQRICGGSADLIGRTAEVAGQPVTIAGILSDDRWTLPGSMDALLLNADPSLGELPSGAKGFVIARIRDSAFPQPSKGWRAIIDTTDSIARCYDCIALSYLLEEPLRVFLFALLLAVIAVPATTALQLGESGQNRERLPRRRKFRRWSFLLVKLTLVLLMVCFWSIDLAFGFSAVKLWTSVYIELATAFPALLFAFRWVLHDQRRRCPECLRLLSNPARVGQASCNFLSWNGTELICSVGHGLLHIPELPTSWFSKQRWLSLDSSWVGLFRESGAATSGML